MPPVISQFLDAVLAAVAVIDLIGLISGSSRSDVPMLALSMPSPFEPR